MGSLTTVVQPAQEPITLAAMKTFLRVDNTAEDTEVQSMISDAREWCEERTGRRLITQQVAWVLDMHWQRPGIDDPVDPDSRVPERYADKMIRSGFWIRHQPHLQFPIAPVQSLTNFTYRLGGSDVEYDMTDTRVTPEGLIIFGPTALPPLSDEQYGAFTITAQVGYSDDASAIPSSFLRAIKMLCNHWYENRGIYYETAQSDRVVEQEMEAAVTKILASKRKLSL